MLRLDARLRRSIDKTLNRQVESITGQRKTQARCPTTFDKLLTSKLFIAAMPRVAANRRDHYAQERRKQILDAAMRAFSCSGFAGATMDEIAHIVGLSKASLYGYFPTKESLLHSLLRRYMLIPNLDQLLEQMRNRAPADGIPWLTTQIWSQLKERKDLANVLIREIYCNPERAKLFAQQIAFPGHRTLAIYLRKWKKQGALDYVNAIAAVQCFFGMLTFLLLYREFMGGSELMPLSDEVVVNTVSQIFLKGLTAKKRPRLRKLARNT